MKHKLQNQCGETIVEVIVSFMLLLMFTAMFVVCRCGTPGPCPKKPRRCGYSPAQKA